MKFPAFLGGIRGKLIAIFVLIKVVPLLLLAWFAWHATSQLGEDVSLKAGGMADAMLSEHQDSRQDRHRRFDPRPRPALARGHRGADHRRRQGNRHFLYDRDSDILQAGRAGTLRGRQLPPISSPNAAAIYQHAPGNWPTTANPGCRKPGRPRSQGDPPRPARQRQGFPCPPAGIPWRSGAAAAFVEMTYVDLELATKRSRSRPAI
jgi:hypothetical protein